MDRKEILDIAREAASRVTVGKGCECIYPLEKNIIDLATADYLVKLEENLFALEKRVKDTIQAEPERRKEYEDLLESNRNITAILSNDIRAVRSRFAAMPSCHPGNPESNPGKEPWQMTEKEYAESMSSLEDRYNELLKLELRGEEYDPHSPVGRERSQSAFGQLKKETGLIGLTFTDMAGMGHRAKVMWALEQGKPVPAVVLADYPELTKGSNPPPEHEITPVGIREGTHPYHPPGDIPAKVYPVRASTGEGYTLYDTIEGVWIGRRSDTYEQAVERADRENRRLWEAYKAFHPQESNPGKEPWQMTEAEFAREALRETFPTATFGGKPLSQLTDVEILATADAYFIKSDLTQDHKYFVEKALSEGKPVPPEVLRDYPDLVRGGNPGRKEPWQMTEDEFVSIYLERFKHMLSKAALAQVTPEELQKKKEEAIDYQKHTIKQALARGELVPPEVLADYPSLLKGAK